MGENQQQQKKGQTAGHKDWGMELRRVSGGHECGDNALNGTLIKSNKIIKLESIECCLNEGSIAGSSMTTATLIKEKHLIGVASIFTRLVHYHHGVTWWHASRHGAGEVTK